MEDAAKLATRTQYLRIKFRAGTTAPNIAGLRRYLEELGSAGRTDPVTITQQSFEGGQTTGQLTDDDVIELQAAMAVLAEIDPTNTPAPVGRLRFADFRGMLTET